MLCHCERPRFICHPRENGDPEILIKEMDSRLRGNDKKGRGNDKNKSPRDDRLNNFMQLNIKVTNLELTPKLKDYVQKKMDMLDKYLGKLKIINARIEVSKTSRHHLKGEIYSAEVNLSLGSDLLRMEKTEKDLFKAIDKVKDHLEMVIKKYKDKKIDRKKKKQKLGAMA